MFFKTTQSYLEIKIPFWGALGMALLGVQPARQEQVPVLVRSFWWLPFLQVAWRKLPCTPTGSTCGDWWAASPTSHSQLTTTFRWWRMLPMGRTSTHVGPSDKRGVPVLRTRPVLVCVAERELADPVLYSWTMFAIWEGDKAKGKPRNKKKEHFSSLSLSFPLLSCPNETKHFVYEPCPLPLKC